MDPRDSETIKGFEGALAAWTDQRFISTDDIRTLAMFTMYLVNLADHDGWTYRGHSWKEADHLGCLVVKAIIDGTPQVVFTSARTLTSGMRIFLRKMEGDFLEWVPDKYG